MPGMIHQHHRVEGSWVKSDGRVLRNGLARTTLKATRGGRVQWSYEFKSVGASLPSANFYEAYRNKLVRGWIRLLRVFRKRECISRTRL